MKNKKEYCPGARNRHFFLLKPTCHDKSIMVRHEISELPGVLPQPDEAIIGCSHCTISDGDERSKPIVFPNYEMVQARRTADCPLRPEATIFDRLPHLALTHAILGVVNKISQILPFSRRQDEVEKPEIKTEI